MRVFEVKEFPVLYTERLVLRQHEEGDAQALFDMRTDERIMQYIDRKRPDELQEVLKLISDLQQGFSDGKVLSWAIALKDQPGHLIGSVGYWRMNLDNFRAEIGYMLHPDYWRKGIVSEALQAAEQFGFNVLNLHSIMANINPGNHASARLLIKAGYVREAYFKEDYYFNGKFLDTEVYGKLKS